MKEGPIIRCNESWPAFKIPFLQKTSKLQSCAKLGETHPPFRCYESSAKITSPSYFAQCEETGSYLCKNTLQGLMNLTGSLQI